VTTHDACVERIASQRDAADRERVAPHQRVGAKAHDGEIARAPAEIAHQQHTLRGLLPRRARRCREQRAKVARRSHGLGQLNLVEPARSAASFGRCSTSSKPARSAASFGRCPATSRSLLDRDEIFHRHGSTIVPAFGGLEDAA
jgi:hypothetical protein